MLILMYMQKLLMLEHFKWQIFLEFILFLGFSYLLITGKTPSSRQGEVLSEWQINTLRSIRLCSKDFNYPLEVAFATGGLLKSTTLICGGEDDDKIVTRKCYAYGFKAKQIRGWKNLVNMSEPRSYSSSVVIGDMLWGDTISPCSDA